MQGMIVFDHCHRRETFLNEVAAMLASGARINRETVAEGLQSAPRAFLNMLAGGNFGKQLVRLS